MENPKPTTKRRGGKHAVTKENRDSVKAAVRSMRQAFPSWSTTRIAAALGIGETTVRSMLEPDDAPKRSHRKKQSTQPTLVQMAIETDEQPDTECQPSREYGTATQTASIIAEREVLGAMAIAAHELMCGARKLEGTISQMDSLLKAAYVKGALAGSSLEDSQEQ